MGKDAQHRLGLSRYIQPMLIGVGAGGSLAYIGQAQSGSGFYRAALSIGLPQVVAMPLRGCGKTTARTAGPNGFALARLPEASQPWFVVAKGANNPVATFVSQMGYARLIGPRQAAVSLLPFLLDPDGSDTPYGLPITEIAASGSGHPKLMAILYSGDGGWAGLDRDMAAQLSARGIPVAGLSSLDYYWQARTPEQSAADLQKMIDFYAQKWGRSEVLLIGYSFGADVMPFVYDALPPATQTQVARIGLIGFADNADFQFHLDNWIVTKDATSRPTLPEVAHMRGDIVCIGGAEDDDNACPRITNPLVRKVTRSGGHHFDGNAAAVVGILLTNLPQKAIVNK